jgi:hypothetical protein
MDTVQNKGFCAMLVSLICASISSVLYRAGGLSKEQKYWIPVWLRHSWVRDWLCPFFCLLPLFIQHPSWIFIPVYGLMGAAFSTYWDKLFKFDNFWFSGFMVGLSIMPLAFCGFVWWHLLIRAFILAVAWGALCQISGNDHVEEHGRGFLAAIA